MELSSLVISVPTVIGVVGCFIGVMTFLGNKKKSDKSEEARLVRMETMLVQIEKNTNNLNERVDCHDHLLTKHETRISVIETKMKSKGKN